MFLNRRLQVLLKLYVWEDQFLQRRVQILCQDCGQRQRVKVQGREMREGYEGRRWELGGGPGQVGKGGGHCVRNFPAKSATEAHATGLRLCYQLSRVFFFNIRGIQLFFSIWMVYVLF